MAPGNHARSEPKIQGQPPVRAVGLNQLAVAPGAPARCQPGRVRALIHFPRLEPGGRPGAVQCVHAPGANRARRRRRWWLGPAARGRGSPICTHIKAEGAPLSLSPVATTPTASCLPLGLGASATATRRDDALRPAVLGGAARCRGPSLAPCVRASMLPRPLLCPPTVHAARAV